MGGCHSATLLRRAPLRALAGGSKPAVFFSDVGGTRVEGAALSHALGQQEDLGWAYGKRGAQAGPSTPSGLLG